MAVRPSAAEMAAVLRAVLEALEAKPPGGTVEIPWTMVWGCNGGGDGGNGGELLEAPPDPVL